VNVGAVPGTKKAELAGTLGITTASLTHIFVVIYLLKNA
jgi:hypothetical protein